MDGLVTARSDASGVAPRSRSGLGFGVACVVYLVLAFWVLGAAWRAPDRLLPYFPLLEQAEHKRAAKLDHLDQSMVVATVTANAAALVTRPWTLPAAAQCYPTPDAHTLGEHMLGLGILAAVPWALSHDPILSFNVALVLTLWIAGVAMYRLAWHFTGSFPAALVAGLLFEMAPRRLADPSHPYVHGDLWTPLALLCLHRAFARARWRDAIGFAAFTSLALLESLYSVLGYAVLLAVYAPYALVRHRERLARALPKLAAAAVFVLLVAWWLFGPYLDARSAWSVLGGRRPMLYGLAHYLPGRVAFPGFVLLALSALGMLDRLRRTRAVDGEDPRLAYLTGGLLLVALTIGRWWIPFTEIAIPSPLLLLRLVVPGLDAVRALPAMGIVAGLPLAFLAGYGVLAIVDRMPRAAAALTTSAILALVVASTFHPAIALPTYGVGSFAAAAWSARPPENEIALVRRTRPGAIVDFPYHASGVYRLAAAIDLLRASYGPRPTAACYNSFGTPVQTQVADLAAALPDAGAAEALRALGFATVIIEHEPFFKAPIDAFEHALRAQPEADKALLKSGRTERLTAYEIRARAPVEQSFAALAPAGDAAGSDLTVPRRGSEIALAVRNDRATTFRHPEPLLPSALLLRWTDAAGALVLEQHARALLPLAIGPGGTGTVRISIVPPPPGSYQLRVARAADPEHVLLERPVTVTAAAPALRPASPAVPPPARP
jgi:hypothetical protein